MNLLELSSTTTCYGFENFSFYTGKSRCYLGEDLKIKDSCTELIHDLVCAGQRCRGWPGPTT
jgi:hypothetical protein